MSKIILNHINGLGEIRTDFCNFLFYINQKKALYFSGVTIYLQN